MEGYQHPYREITVTAGETAVGDRFPQWSAQETKEFLTVRAEMDRAFMETKRNKILWEVISSRLKERGFFRNAEQCKSKWKNLVTRYKGSETMEQDQETRLQQFPFYNELHTIFSSRLHHMVWAEAEGSGATAGGTGAPSSSRKRKAKAATTSDVQMSSSDNDDDEEDFKGDINSDEGDNKGRRKKTTNKKKKAKSEGSAMREVLEVFMRQQEAMEEKWREAYEAREEERRRSEAEWRRKMAALEEERRRMEMVWREREEERRVREETRANTRDALINALLNSLRRDDHM